jgi:hypothetical protein
MTEVAGNKYRPSNGTDGDIFIERFCNHCRKDAVCEGCEIQLRTMAFDIDEPEYPTEWVYDADGKPTCTDFESR